MYTTILQKPTVIVEYVLGLRLKLTPLNFIFKLVLAFDELLEIVVVDGLSIGSIAGIPTRVNRSANIADFNRTSNGLSHPSEGERFISNSHGFKVSSTNISKPYNSVRLI